MKNQTFLYIAIATLASMPSVAEDALASFDAEFVEIEAGCFMMGRSVDDERPEYFDDESPRHKVCISKPFYMGKTEITQAQWVAVMGKNPSKHPGNENPVETVSWNNVQEFLAKLNEMDTGHRYRLPTEAEWEYAARAGSESIYYFGNDAEYLEHYAWYGYKYDDEGANWGTHPVAKKIPNKWGLYDMHGNVWEWVSDRYDESYYSKSPITDPQGSLLEGSEAPSDGSTFDRRISDLESGRRVQYEERVLRGGGWRHQASRLTSSARLRIAPNRGGNEIGFRIVREN